MFLLLSKRVGLCSLSAKMSRTDVSNGNWRNVPRVFHLWSDTDRRNWFREENSDRSFSILMKLIR